ncbi:hypothetical protein CGGC5_v007524 [Colletotrichum fructicola Nara gc5]|uniref:Uncharacterized protein n=1 Tax=Colletotrichum fructicola (strain Nara gc5) TaxID=1213859 RepID=A0A7J6J556_COLFN|nr:hypothetical protein CGGC5_v007524 [Colletotrichum fructicola Nara gc5]
MITLAVDRLGSDRFGGSRRAVHRQKSLANCDPANASNNHWLTGSGSRSLKPYCSTASASTDWQTVPNPGCLASVFHPTRCGNCQSCHSLNRLTIRGPVVLHRLARQATNISKGQEVRPRTQSHLWVKEERELTSNRRIRSCCISHGPTIKTVGSWWLVLRLRHQSTTPSPALV